MRGFSIAAGASRSSIAAGASHPVGNVKPIVEYPSNVLTSKAAVVEVPFAAQTQQLLADLVATCHQQDGLGLAAPQLGVGLRAFVMRRPSPNRLTRSWRRAAAATSIADFWVCVNPRIVSAAGPGIIGLEACLSVPDCNLLVRRQRDIGVEFTDVNGTPLSLRLEGLPAVVFQHELDHLDGVLLTDREQRSFEHSSYTQELHRAEELWEADVLRYYKSLIQGIA